MSALEISLLGRVGIVAEDGFQADLTFSGRRSCVVFAALALGAGAPIGRDQLVAAVWGDRIPPTWASATRIAVAVARKTLAGCPRLAAAAIDRVGDGWRLTLPAHVTVDVTTLLELADAMDATLADDPIAALRAAESCRNLAERVFLPGGSGSWTDGWRRRLRQLLLSAVQIETAAALALGDGALARRRVEHALRIDPGDERSQLLLMRCLMAAGADSDAVRAYHAYREMLMDELGVEPGAGMYAAFLDALGMHGAVSAGTDSVPGPPANAAAALPVSAVGNARTAVRQAEEATTSGQYLLATHHYRAALDTLDALDPGYPARSATLKLALADSLERTGNQAVSDRLRFDAADLIRQTHDQDRLADAALSFGSISPPWLDHDHRRIVALLREALDATDARHIAVRARLTSRLASWATWTAPRNERRNLAADALQLARASKDPGTVIGVLADRAFSPPQRAEDVLVTEQAGLTLLDEFAPLLPPDLEFLARSWVSEGQLLRGELVAVRLSLKKLSAHAAARPNAHFCWRVAAIRAMDATVRGDLEAAEQHTEEARRYGQDLPSPAIEGVRIAQLLVIRASQGRAREMLTAVESLAEADPHIDWRDTLAWLYAEDGQTRSSRRLFKLLDPDRFTADTAADPWMHWATNLVGFARACAMVGEPTPAAKVYSTFASRGSFMMTATNVVCYGAVDEALGQLADAMGRPDLARRHRTAAQARYLKMGASRFMDGTRRSVGQLPDR